MMTDLTDEVVECVLAKVRAGDVPEDIAGAAATNDIETADILEMMIARELERRVLAGEVIAHGAMPESW